MPPRGYKLTDEQKRKISLALMGNKYALGKRWKLTKETRAKMSKALLGNTRWVGKKHTKEWVEKMKLRNSGPNSHWWKGGVTPEHVKLRTSTRMKEWRTAVFKKNNYTCVMCGNKNGNGHTVYLEADHIKPFSLYPELRFDINNGRTLCKPCHIKTDTYGNKIFHS